MKIRIWVLFLALALLAGSSVFGQSITGSITGIVTDPSGSVIPNVSVMVVNTETNVSTTVTSDSTGNYTAPLLPRGEYRVEVTAAGFKRFVREGIVLQVQQTARVDVQMTVGEVAESVSVTADAARLETESATLAKVVDNRAIVNLPLNTRNVYNLVFLTPGVTGTVGNSYGEMRYSVNGARAAHHGHDDRRRLGGPPHGERLRRHFGLPVGGRDRGIQAARRRLSGRVRPQPGQRAERGLQVRHQQRGTAARTSFCATPRWTPTTSSTTAAASSCSASSARSIGGVLNGPVIKDKTFFMVSYEALRERRASIPPSPPCRRRSNAPATSRKPAPPTARSS